MGSLYWIGPQIVHSAVCNFAQLNAWIYNDIIVVLCRSCAPTETNTHARIQAQIRHDTG